MKKYLLIPFLAFIILVVFRTQLGFDNSGMGASTISTLGYIIAIPVGIVLGLIFGNELVLSARKPHLPKPKHVIPKISFLRKVH